MCDRASAVRTPTDDVQPLSAQVPPKGSAKIAAGFACAVLAVAVAVATLVTDDVANNRGEHRLAALRRIKAL